MISEAFAFTTYDVMGSYLRTAIIFTLMLGLVSCWSFDIPERGESLQLAASTENDVKVMIALEHEENDQFVLSATFAPLVPGLYFYSKDIPKNGVDGLGRPTLLELTQNSKMIVLGELTESVAAYPTNFEPKELLVYPPGEVKLSLPIELPSGKGWVDEEVNVTYMACSEKGCKPPVIGKTIAVHVPCRETVLNP